MILFVGAATTLPSLITHPTFAKYSRATGDARAVVTQAIIYANDHGVYPTSIKVLVDEGYGSLPDKDPWGNAWVLAPVLTEGRTPREGDNVYVFSKGPIGAGRYPRPFTSDTGPNGAVGSSSIDGCFGDPRAS